MIRRCLAVLFFGISATCLATDYTHTGTANGVWSTTTDWTPTGFPNASGDIARYNASTSITTTQDVVAGITVGTITRGGGGAATWTITPTNPITLNQDGAGSGTATLSNTGTSVGSSRLVLGVGTLTLADDLLVSNSGTSTAASGAIQLSSTIGGTGNVTFTNVSNNPDVAAIVLSGTNTYTGSNTISAGAVIYSSNSPFGNSANALSVGSNGAASLVSTTSTTTLSNNIVVGFASTIGGNSTAGTNGATYAGTLTLNANVALTSATTASGSVKFTNAISGFGGISKVGTGTVTLSGTGNSYQGGTSISAGTLIAAKDSALGTGNVSLLAASVTLTLQGGVTNNYIGDTVNLNIGFTNDVVNLNFAGTDTIGSLTVNGVQEPAGVYGASGVGVTVLPEFSGTGTLTVLGVIPEPSTWAMVGFGAVLLIAAQRSRRIRA